jgi:hypothetical protein
MYLREGKFMATVDKLVWFELRMPLTERPLRCFLGCRISSCMSGKGAYD